MKGVWRSIINLGFEFVVFGLHYISVAKAYKYKNHKDLKLNVGCGKNYKGGWVNITLGFSGDLSLDMRERFPFKDGSCALIYSEHFFEHLEYPTDALHFLKESYRLLKPGGIFSVGVPDTEWPILAYVGKDSEYPVDYFGWVKEKWHPKWCSTKLDHINFHFRQKTKHKYAYDFETLEYVLKVSGFSNIRRRNFNPDLDDKEREIGTLYVDADKSI